MEISPKNMEDQRMSDLAMARSYVDDIGGNEPVKRKLWKAHDLLTEMFPHSEEQRWQWTLRRLRAFWNLEAARVEHREMIELHLAAERAVAERASLEQARKEHAAFIEKTASIRAFLERQDEAFHSPQIEGMERGLCRMDSAGNPRNPN